LMKLKLLAKFCGFMKIKLIKPNIIIETKLEPNAFKHIKSNLPQNIQSKLIYQNDKVLSKITIRGLGVTDSQNQVDNLINWFSIMAKSVNKLIKTQESKD